MAFHRRAEHAVEILFGLMQQFLTQDFELMWAAGGDHGGVGPVGRSGTGGLMARTGRRDQGGSPFIQRLLLVPKNSAEKEYLFVAILFGINDRFAQLAH